MNLEQAARDWLESEGQMDALVAFKAGWQAAKLSLLAQDAAKDAELIGLYCMISMLRGAPEMYPIAAKLAAETARADAEAKVVEKCCDFTHSYDDLDEMRVDGRLLTHCDNLRQMARSRYGARVAERKGEE